MRSLKIVPLDLEEANILVERWHRHHKKVPGCKFVVGISNDGNICGAAIVGRPVSRMLDNGSTLEINRLVTDGTKNACSKLLSACKRISQLMGYEQLITYTLPEESQSSLKAAGFKKILLTNGGSWNCESRPRVDKHPLQQKIKWVA